MGIFEKFYESKRREQIDEGVRKVGEHINGNKKATVHKDSDVGEYKVKFHTDGKHHAEADYHTDDKDDAHGTAKHWINKTNEAVETIDESAVLIEYIQDLEEKLAAFVKGVAPAGNSSNAKARSPDDRKHEPAHAASRKEAADKIRAARKSTGARGSSIEDADHKNISVYKIPSIKSKSA